MKKKELKQHIQKRMNYLLDNDAGEFEWICELAEREFFALLNVVELIENGMSKDFNWDFINAIHE